MGEILNPNNKAFKKSINSEIYVDKTDLISYTNKVLDTDQCFICNTRPRRFGKSFTANMLSAYYSKGYDSKELFKNLNISKDPSFEKYLNRFDVIYFDVQECIKQAGCIENTVSFIENQSIHELQQAYSTINFENINTLIGTIGKINTETDNQFIFIIDEWDVLIRNYSNNEKIQNEYIDFLRSIFKSAKASRSIALAYLTGILPIKKQKTQSALNNFYEFTMLNQAQLSPFIGFTENEVKELCTKYDKDFNKVQEWYDGYLLGNEHIYNPRAVVSLMLMGSFESYWSDTASYENIIPYIDMNYDNLHESIIKLISGQSVPVDVTTFRNDVIHIESRDEVLTYLIHLGYLAYHDGMTYVPNKEVSLELSKAIRKTKSNDYIEYGLQSKNLLDCTIAQNEKEVSTILEQIHSQYTSIMSYNTENSLSNVITIAYFYAMNYYYSPIREFPTGKGYADLIYLPKKEYALDYPALVVELKWNKDVDTAMHQIKEKKYPESLTQYTGNILLVAINYDKKTKEHQCKIEQFSK